MELSESFVQEVSPPEGRGKQSFYRDSRLIGFALRVSSGGTKTYILERRIRGKVKRITLGRCDEMPFDKARARAVKLIHEVERENAPRIVYGKVVDADIELLTAYFDYLESHQELNELTRADYQRSMDGPLKNWHSIPVRELTTELITHKHESYGKQYPARSNNAMRLLRAILNHVRWKMLTDQHHPILTSNPVDILSRRKLWYPVNSSNDKAMLSPENLKEWWQASLEIKKRSTRDYLHFLLLSGYPPAIVSQLRYRDFDFNKGAITIRYGTDPENPLILPLSEYLNNLVYKHQERVFNDDLFVFPGAGNKPITDPRTTMKKIQLQSGIGFNLKDLHRLFLQLAAADGEKSRIDTMQSLYRGKLKQITAQDFIELNNALRHVESRIKSII